MRWVAGLVALACAARLAHADAGGVGVATVGDATLQVQVARHVEKWLQDHGRRLTPSPLSKDALTTLGNCFLLDDHKCARGVFEARSKAPTLVLARVEASGKDVTLDIYWLVKGHGPIGERQVCEGCGSEAWQKLLDSMLDRLSAAAGVPTGKLVLESRPPGLVALVDGANIGITPVERDVPAGKRTVTVTHEGRVVGEREIEIIAGETQRLTIKADAYDPRGTEGRRSRWLGGTLLGVGLAAIASGGVFLYLGTRGDQPDEKWTYPDATPTGIVLMAVGGGAAIGGTLLLIRSGSSQSGPVASMGKGGAYVGWVSSF